ncbi:hypothetical protein NM208_g1078 [Fusarium decemcellulare]|uniref:Uncharacterized protein n=1 Tax=Fusarium decemcellulare TaxID=57161 RepID=A0ACC1SX45_9HYPO|nr:hypothetical protein NM208_g1078 [Fusarium decemcellulare]
MNMNGWDVASLVSIPFVNASIQSQGGSPRNMQVSADDLAVQAMFGTWQIAVGGSANNLIFNIPLATISGTVTDDGQTISQFNYESLAARVQFVLTFVDGNSGQNLVVDSTRPPTSVDSLIDVNGQSLSDEMHDALIKKALIAWFGDNLSRFNHVFASIDLDPSIGLSTQWAFCKPTVAAYTHVCGSSLANSYLGLVYNTAGKTTPGSAAHIDPTFIPPGCQAGIMLSPAMFLANFLTPAAGQQFGLASDQLCVDTNELRIMLAAGAQVALPKIPIGNSKGSGATGGTSDSDSDTYQPYLIDLQVAVDDAVITTYSRTSTVVLDESYGTLSAFNDSKSWMTLGFDKSSQSLTYTSTYPSINDHYTEQSQEFEIVQRALEAVGDVTLAVYAALADDADLLMAGALAGVAQGGEQSSTQSNNRDNTTEISDLVSNLTSPIRLPGAKPFAVKQAGLYQGGFFLAGAL